MPWRVVSFDLTNVIFAACVTLRGHDTHIDFLYVLFLVGRIGPQYYTMLRDKPHFGFPLDFPHTNLDFLHTN